MLAARHICRAWWRQNHRAGAGRSGARPPLRGVDSLHSIVTVPKGVPVATFAIGAVRRGQRRAVCWAMLANAMTRYAQDWKISANARPKPRAHDAASARLKPTCPCRRFCNLLLTPASMTTTSPPLGVLGGNRGACWCMLPSAWATAPWCSTLPPTVRRAKPATARLWPPMTTCADGSNCLIPVTPLPPNSRTCPPPRWTYLSARKPVSPPAAAVAIAQDRALEKQHFTRCGVPCAPYRVIATADDVAQAPASLFPAILKQHAWATTASQSQVKQRQRAGASMAGYGTRRRACWSRLLLAQECSVIVARAMPMGRWRIFQPQRNIHHGGILATTYAFAGAVPAHLSTPWYRLPTHRRRA